jgi:hypothetical protein
MTARKAVKNAAKAEQGQRKISDEELEIWAAQQRVKYRDGELSPTQIRKIEEISGWSWQISKTANP